MWRCETHVRAMINKNVPRVTSSAEARPPTSDLGVGRGGREGRGKGKRRTASESLARLIIGNNGEREGHGVRRHRPTDRSLSCIRAWGGGVSCAPDRSVGPRMTLSVCLCVTVKRGR